MMDMCCGDEVEGGSLLFCNLFGLSLQPLCIFLRLTIRFPKQNGIRFIMYLET